jgi:glycine/D-amino acid oxidase-like deaminating enzyme
MDVAIIGAGIAGIAAAYYLSRSTGIGSITLIDRGQPMAFTSAQSGENYRNWWPHPTMTAFTDLSIDLMEELARESDDRFSMTRRGYALATRRGDIDDLMHALTVGYSDSERDLIRVHDQPGSRCYRRPLSADWRAAPEGVDVLQDPALIGESFPGFAGDIRTVIHIRRAGDVDSQQLGQLMLERAREKNMVRLTGEVISVEADPQGFSIEVSAADGKQTVQADVLVNAAGPFVGRVGKMIGYDLPVKNVRQQKVAFDDRAKTILRDMPFSIDLDPLTLDWNREEAALLLADPRTAWLAQPMPGAIHCKAEGGERGTWVKLGWAFTSEPSAPGWTPELDDTFPEVVLRGAARLHPALKSYYGRFPRPMSHYGGYYTMTEENWPIIGRAGPDGSYVVGALSGFGTMAACAAGYLLAQSITGGLLPSYAASLGLDRLAIPQLMKTLRAAAHTSVL